MVKNLVDGSKAVALFNRNHEPKEVAISWNELGITGKQQLRDLCRQKNIGTFSSSFKTIVPAQGVVMLKFKKVRK